MSGNRIAVIFDNGGDTSSEGSERKPTEYSHKLHIDWIDGIFTSWRSILLMFDRYIFGESVCRQLTSYVNVANLYIVCAVGDLKHDLDMQAEDGYIAMEALSEVCVEAFMFSCCFSANALYIGLI